MSLKIIQGEDRIITVQLKDGDGANFDLTPYIGQTVEACFIGTAGVVTKTLASGDIVLFSPEACGKLTISLDDTDTGLLDTSGKDFEIQLTNASSETRIVQLKGVLDISESIC